MSEITTLDSRYNNDTLFNQRSKEWDLDVIKERISKIFSNVDKLDNYKFVKATWGYTKRIGNEELKKNLYKTLTIHVDQYTIKGEVKKKHLYHFKIPLIVRKQFFFVGGLYKLPIFQLYDDPIIYKKTNKGTLLKYKSNVCSINVNLYKKNFGTCNIFTNNMPVIKNVPMELIICNMFTRDEFNEYIQTLSPDEDLLKYIKTKCNMLWDSKINKKDLLEQLGNYRTSNNKVDKIKKGESILFALNNIYDIDIFIQDVMKTDNPIKELLYAISEGIRSDTDLNNKRLRFSEYILSEVSKNVYDMICVLNYNKKVRFKIAQSIILETCNVNSIIHYNFPYNPINEISSLLQCTLIGPNSFKKENVPSHLKDVDESQFGKICPVDTPDRDGCGTVLNLVSNIDLSNDNKIVQTSDECVSSYPITLIPFMQNDEQTRLQMASSQSKQSILLKDASKPFIKTGAESNFLHHSTFKNIADDNGEVIYKDEYRIIVQYQNNIVDIFELGYRPMYLNSADLMYTKLDVGSKFKKNDVISISKFIQDDDITLGQNLITSVVIWGGYNYEDGIVISESTAEKFTSMHIIDLTFEIEGGQILLSLDDDVYSPLPKVGDTLNRGDVYAKVKHMYEDGIESVNFEAKELAVPDDCIITKIEIFPNTWNKQIINFNDFIVNTITTQQQNVDDIKSLLKKRITTEEINNLFTLNKISRLESVNKLDKFREKGNNINGIKFIVEAICYKKIEIGDKISNRHAAKGVVSQILPDDKMPITEDGRVIDIIINPLGIISRMNVGQLYELHLTESLYHFKNKAKEMLKSKESKKKIYKFLETYLDYFDNTDDKWPSKITLKKFKLDSVKSYINAIDNIQIIQPAFKSIKPEKLLELKEFLDIEYSQTIIDRENILDPINDSGNKLDNKISVGYMYFYKLIHTSTDKIMSRSIGPYVNNTSQPVSGKKNLGGHRLGELESWALLAHGADELLKDFLTIHSDSINGKAKVLEDILHNKRITNKNNLINNKINTPRTLMLLESYLKIMGINIEK